MLRELTREVTGAFARPAEHSEARRTPAFRDGLTQIRADQI
jgi:hypothetical protein